MFWKLVLVCLLDGVLLAQGRGGFATAPVEKASSLVSLKASISTLSTSVTCINETLGCCLRSLTTGQIHLDLLDSDIPDNLTKLPSECSKKMDIFLISTGIDDNDAFRDANIVIEPDCVVNNSNTNDTFTPIRDQSGEGTIMSGAIGWPYGVSPNMIIHMIKAGEFYGTSSVSSLLCGIGQVRAWLSKYICKRAMVVMTQEIVQDVPVDDLHPISIAVRSLVHDFGNRIVFLSFPETDTLGDENTTLYTPPGNLPEVLRVSSDFLNASDPDASTILIGPTTDIYVQTGRALLPFLNNTIERHTYYDAAVAMTAAVLAEYWLLHPHLTGHQLRDMIRNNDESDVHVTGGVTVPVPGVTNKRLKYNCKTNCEPCKNGGVLVNDPPVIRPGRAVCACPRETTGDRCDTLICPTNCTFAHPGDCGKYVTCRDGRPVTTSCGLNGCEQMLFDTVKQRCRPRCEATLRLGCDITC